MPETVEVLIRFVSNGVNRPGMPDQVGIIGLVSMVGSSAIAARRRWA
jgi:hypothetical protein